MDVNHPIATIRRIRSPRENALRDYAQRHDQFSEAEQIHRLAGEAQEAQDAHLAATICLRAYIAEKDEAER